MKLKSLVTYVFASLLLCLPFSVFAQQQESVGAPGTEQPLFRKTDGSTGNSCYVYKQYVVMTVSSEDVGEDIKIYKRNGATDARAECGSTKRAVYMTLKNAGENYFFGLTGDKFLVDSGTSAGIRGLEIVNLTTKKAFFRASIKMKPKLSETQLFTISLQKPTAR